MTSMRSAVILVGSSIECYFSLQNILKTECNVAGVVFCNQAGFKARFLYERKVFTKYGFLKRFSQILLSVLYFLRYGRDDLKYKNKCFHYITFQLIKDELDKKNISYINTSSYSSKKSLDFLKSKSPHFLVCHTPHWISKEVRAIPKDKLIIGSHPGIVPYYRGAHSAFWCFLDRCSHQNGYSIFCIDDGVDSGPVIMKSKIKYDKNISFKANDYLIMSKMTFSLATIAKDYSNGKKIKHSPQEHLTASQVRQAPGIIDYLNYLKILKEKK